MLLSVTIQRVWEFVKHTYYKKGMSLLFLNLLAVFVTQTNCSKIIRLFFLKSSCSVCEEHFLYKTYKFIILKSFLMFMEHT